MRATVAIALLALLTGCPSLTNMHTARPVAEGQTRLGFSPIIVGAGDMIEDGENLIAPSFELQVRHGVSESWDFGVKAYPVGIQADFNFLLVDSDGFAMSLDPAITVLVATGVVGFYPWLALLFDLGSPDGVIFTLGPRVGGAFGSGGVAGAILGGVAGVTFPLTENFSIGPEFTGYALLGNGGSAFIWTGGIAFSFGL